MRSIDVRESAHRVHDYPYLVRRWRKVAREAGLKLVAFAEQQGHPVYCLQSASTSRPGGLYLSAGIHGDEPAGVEALTRWAEEHLAAHVRTAGAVPLFLLPCLNPWGLVHNVRTDHKSRDLNRIFDGRVSPIPELRRQLTGHRFDLALHLHEDYDAQGIYLYEVNTGAPSWGTALLRGCATATLPIERRRRIDGMPFRNGLLTRPIDLKDVPLVPEALYLLLNHSDHVCTFETPSEFGLSRRVRAHVQMIRACLRRLSKAAGKPAAG